MKLAAGDFGVWLIIAIIVMIGKLWNKFVTPPTDENEPAPPPIRRTRPAQPPRVKRAAPPAVRPATEKTWQARPEDLRGFMERVTHPPQSKPVPAPLPIVAAAPEPVPPPPTPKSPARPKSKWMDMLRDRQNLRNIIISAEIIGPPRGA